MRLSEYRMDLPTLPSVSILDEKKITFFHQFSFFFVFLHAVKCGKSINN